MLIVVSVATTLPATVVAITIFFGGGRALALDLIRPFFEHPGYLLLLLFINAAVLTFRIAAGLDIFWLTGGGFAGRKIAAGVAAVAIVAIAAPHAWAAQRNLALYNLLIYDYSADPNQAATTTTTTTTAPISTLTTVFPAISAATPPTTTTTPPTTTTTLPGLAERRVNILLLGGDAGPDRSGLRTDTIIVVSVDPATGNTALLQLPRNQIDLPIPAGHLAYDVWECHCYPELSNTIYQYGLAHPELFPGGNNSGATAVMDFVGHLYGIEIHNYVQIGRAHV